MHLKSVSSQTSPSWLKWNARASEGGRLVLSDTTQTYRRRLGTDFKHIKMAPVASLTKSTLLECTNDNKENNKLSHNQKLIMQLDGRTNENSIVNPIDVYDESLPGNDPWFLEPVRNWEKSFGFITPLKWINLISISIFHIGTVVLVLYLCLWLHIMAKWQTTLFGIFVGLVGGFGVTGGVHRYWCHRSYKAKKPLQIILMLCYSVAGQNNIYNWVRDHRVHHKFSETSADPHDVSRGFFFSHVGWLMMRKHPAVLQEGAKIDMSDIANDTIVKFHTKYFVIFKLMFCFILPSITPRLWGESWLVSVLSQSLLRYMFTLNFTWSVNSFAHLWGNKPYDRFIKPAENWGVSVVAMGEGWHNYHHTFPWDYKAAELAYTLNCTTYILDQFAKIGWAYDMKKASPELIKAVAKRKGEQCEH